MFIVILKTNNNLKQFRNTSVKKYSTNTHVWEELGNKTSRDTVIKLGLDRGKGLYLSIR